MRGSGAHRASSTPLDIPRLSRAAPTSRTACRHRPRRLLAGPVRHRRRYAARRHLARCSRTPPESRTTTSLPFTRCLSHRHSRPPPCPTSLGSPGGGGRRQDASGTCHMYVIEGGTCINCAAAARSGVMPPILYLKLSHNIDSPVTFGRESTSESMLESTCESMSESSS